MAQGEKAKTKKKPKLKLRDKAQSERFIEAARELGIEETGSRFDDNFTAIVSTKRQSPKNI